MHSFEKKRYQSNCEGMENAYIQILGLFFSYLTVIYSIYFGFYQGKNHVGYVYNTSSMQRCIQKGAFFSQISTMVLYKSNRLSYNTKELKQYRPRNFIMPRFNKEICSYIDSLGIRRKFRGVRGQHKDKNNKLRTFNYNFGIHPEHLRSLKK